MPDEMIKGAVALREQRPVPFPGSDDAQAEGCRCPVIDNRRGRGAYNSPTTGEPQFWINVDCPIHGESPVEHRPPLGAEVFVRTPEGRDVKIGVITYIAQDADCKRLAYAVTVCDDSQDVGRKTPSWALRWPVRKERPVGGKGWHV